MASSKRSSSSNHKEKIIRRKEEQPVEPELPKYRDRAKERREDQNPDYEASELGSFHAVAPPRTVDLLSVLLMATSYQSRRASILEVMWTTPIWLTKREVRLIRNKMLEMMMMASLAPKEDQPVSFCTATAKSVYQWIVKSQTVVKSNEMFLQGRMAFIFNMDMSLGMGHEKGSWASF